MAALNWDYDSEGEMWAAHLGEYRHLYVKKGRTTGAWTIEASFVELNKQFSISSPYFDEEAKREAERILLQACLQQIGELTDALKFLTEESVMITWKELGNGEGYEGVVGPYIIDLYKETMPLEHKCWVASCELLWWLHRWPVSHSTEEIQLLVAIEFGMKVDEKLAQLQEAKKHLQQEE